jgi:hypothetical protein|tara:strand:- start:498 stop:1025 length:528 start_codon:yes stop_codon:yes gene_type:complete
LNLTEKEIKYINAIIEADGDIDLDFVLNMINKKRSPADAVDIDDVLTVIERLSSTPNGIEGNTESSVVSESTTIGKNLKKAQQVRDANDVEALAERSTYIAAHVLEKLEPVVEQLKMPMRPRHYTILSGKTQAYLSAEVNKHMKQGWQPYGGVSAAAFGISPVAGNQYIQAMVIY